MSSEPTKPIATSADGAGMEQASTTDHPDGDAMKQDGEQEEPAAEEAAAQLGDFA